MEDAARSLAQELAPQGSEDYYIARLHPASEREGVALHLALEERLLAVLREARSPEAARLKLLWWRECFAAATRGEHRHPLIAALAERRPADTSRWPGAFVTAAEALVERLDWQAPQAQANWLANLGACEGGLAVALAADARGAPTGPVLTPLGDLAAATQWARGLQWLPRWQRIGLHWLPREDLERHALAAVPGDHTSHPGEHWAVLAGDFTARCLGQAREARRGLTPEVRRAGLASRIRLALACLELHQAARSGWPVMKERVALTPFRRLITGLAVAWFDHLPKVDLQHRLESAGLGRRPS